MRNVATFAALAFVISWAAWLPILLTDGEVMSGQGWPTHLPGLLGPAVAAIIVVWREGPAARADLWRRCRMLPKGRLAWSASLSPLAMLATAVLAERMAAGAWPEPSALGRYSGLPEFGVLPVLVIVLVVNGFGEEIGWRGFLLPRL